MFRSVIGALESAVSGAMEASGVMDVDKDGEVNMDAVEELL